MLHRHSEQDHSELDEWGPSQIQNDATLADFDHEVGHSHCRACESIRKQGPREPRNTLATMPERLGGAPPDEPVQDKKALRNAARKARKAGKRYKALALAIKAA